MRIIPCSSAAAAILFIVLPATMVFTTASEYATTMLAPCLCPFDNLSNNARSIITLAAFSDWGWKVLTIGVNHCFSMASINNVGCDLAQQRWFSWYKLVARRR